MIRDRGMTKWTAMMLPEHTQKIHEWKREAYVEAPRELTEWELEDLQQTIERAFTQQTLVTITTWNDGKYTSWTGTIKALNEETQQLFLEINTTTKSISRHVIDAANLENEGYD